MQKNPTPTTPTTAINPVHRALVTLRGEDGLTTVEYALGTLAAAALAILLYTVVNSGAVASAFEDIIVNALNTAP